MTPDFQLLYKNRHATQNPITFSPYQTARFPTADLPTTPINQYLKMLTAE
jgi:hypothetical protein